MIWVSATHSVAFTWFGTTGTPSTINRQGTICNDLKMYAVHFHFTSFHTITQQIHNRYDYPYIVDCSALFAGEFILIIHFAFCYCLWYDWFQIVINPPDTHYIHCETLLFVLLSKLSKGYIAILFIYIPKPGHNSTNLVSSILIK